MGAKPVQGDLVVFELETRRCHGLKIACTRVDLENAVALAAMKMVMMGFARQLVARRCTGQLHDPQSTLSHQIPNIPVDGRDSQTWNIVLGSV